MPVIPPPTALPPPRPRSGDRSRFGSTTPALGPVPGLTTYAATKHGLLDSRKLVIAIPRWRGWIARTLAPFPRLGLRILDLLRRVGERERRKRAKAGP